MDAERFAKTWLPLGGRFYKVACYILESETMAEDAVQDLYIRLWNARDRLDAVLLPDAYGMAMLKNLCLDRIRHAAVARTEPEEAGENRAGPDPPPDVLLADKEALRHLKELIAKLPDKQRKVLQMRVFQGLEYDEISERTGWSGIYLRVLLSQARKTLKRQMEEWE